MKKSKLSKMGEFEEIRERIEGAKCTCGYDDLMSDIKSG